MRPGRGASRWRLALVWGGIALVSLILAWQMTAEAIEPRLLLRIGGWLGLESPPLEFTIGSRNALWVYPDTQPHVGKIAGLQKGLVWTQGARELIEEGYGFGCPIVVSGGRAYLSRHAAITVTRQAESVILTKTYSMDTVDTPVRLLRRKYRSAPSLGIVTMRYDIRTDGAIEVTADLSQLGAAWERAYLMNEQGASHFIHYRDDSGANRTADGIGPWQPVAVQHACFDGDGNQLSFCVEAAAPARLYYGREHRQLLSWRGVSGLSWSGIDLEIAAPNRRIQYQISLSVRPDG